VALVEIGRGGEVGELRGGTAELLVGLARAEECCSGGSAAASSLPGLRMNGGGVLGSGGGEMAKGRGERVVGLLVVLVRTTEESGGLYLGRATTAARWRPAGALGARGKGRRTPA
jgi:hypothetical protein